MTLQTSQAAEMNLQAELDRLTCSAYLLTLDPAMALSVVMAALDWSSEEVAADYDLLRRSVELSLEQLCLRSRMGWDHESSVYDAVLYADSNSMNSKPFLSLTQDISGNPIFLLDSSSRVAFVLHHVVGYKVEEVATRAKMSEEEFRAQLRKAYVQLASVHLDAHSNVLGEAALA
jgi:phage major head subunit gpT-like protein